MNKDDNSNNVSDSKNDNNNLVNKVLKIFKKVPFAIWVLGAVFLGVLLGFLFPNSEVVAGLAASGQIFPQFIVTFAAPIILFLLTGSISKLFIEQREKAGGYLLRIVLSYVILGLTTLIFAFIFLLAFVGLSFDTSEETASFGTYVTEVLSTFTTIVTDQPLFQMLVASALIGWLAPAYKKTYLIAQTIMKISNSILRVFKWLMWYYPIMIGCLSINIPLTFGGEGIESYGQLLLWVAIASISFSLLFLLVTKFVSKRSWSQIFKYYFTVYPTGFGTAGSYDTLAVNIISAERDLELRPEIAETSIVFGTVLNKSQSTMTMMLITTMTCMMLDIPFSLHEVLLLIIPIWLLGLESPGIPGGAGFFMAPIIAVILEVPDSTLFVSTFIALNTGLIPMLTTAVNTTGDGFIGALLNDRILPQANSEVIPAKRINPKSNY